MIGTFIAYIASIAWAIYKGVVAPPEDSDSDSDGDDSSDSSSDSDDEHHHDEESAIPLRTKASPSQISLGSQHSDTTTLHETSPRRTTHTEAPLAPEIFEDVEPNPPSQSQTLNKTDFDNISPKIKTAKPGSSTPRHLLHLTFGFLALSLSGYILSHSLTTIAESFSLSTTLLGTTFLSLATTLPEKLLSILSSRSGQHGIVIANTAGSNIFLVTLCAGVLFTSGDLVSLKDSVTLFEVGCMWVSSAVLFGIVMVGGKRWMGWALFGAYIAFLVLEFTLNRR